MTVSIAYAPSNAANTGALDSAPTSRSISTAIAVLVQNRSPTGTWLLRKYKRDAVGMEVHGLPGARSPMTTQLCARTVVARLGLRAARLVERAGSPHVRAGSMLCCVVNGPGMIPSPSHGMPLFDQPHQLSCDGLAVPRSVLRKTRDVSPLFLQAETGEDLRDRMFHRTEHGARDPLGKPRPPAKGKHSTKALQKRLPFRAKSFSIIHDALLSGVRRVVSKRMISRRGRPCEYQKS